MDRVHVSFQPRLLAISDFHVVAADSDVVYTWHYMASNSKLSAMDLQAGLRKGGAMERMFHIDHC